MVLKRSKDEVIQLPSLHAVSQVDIKMFQHVNVAQTSWKLGKWQKSF